MRHVMGLSPSRRQRLREPPQFVVKEIPARRELAHVKRARLAEGSGAKRLVSGGLRPEALVVEPFGARP